MLTVSPPTPHAKAVTRRTLISAALLGTLLFSFDVLFWQSGLGINIPIFHLLVIATLYVRFKSRFRSIYVRGLVAGTLLTAAMVVVHHSVLSIMLAILSMLCLSAFVTVPSVRSPLMGMVQSGLHIIVNPFRFINGLQLTTYILPGGRRLSGRIGWAVIPLGITTVFILLYGAANSVFQGYVSKIMEVIQPIINYLIDWKNIDRIFFLAFGLFICILLIWPFSLVPLKEAELPDELNRQTRKETLAYRVRSYYASMRQNMLGLKRFSLSGSLLFLLLNLILLVVNFIDVRWVWFGFDLDDQSPDFQLKAFVHEGTFILIFSILLSMGILLYYFKGNLNFYERNKTLRHLAYAWIIQNGILAISVFWRNYHYIQYHGLGPLRIGVFAFLALTLFGLFTLAWKIRDKKTASFLVRVNSWAVYVVLCAMCLVNWDRQIVSFNLAHPHLSGIDVDFYLEATENNLPLVRENLPIIEKQIQAHSTDVDRWIYYTSIKDFQRALFDRESNYRMELNEAKWGGWNLPDARARQYYTLKQRSETVR